jgi:hypothetical protein
MTPLYRDRDGDLWEVPTDMLRNVDTGRVMTREEVADFFGPLVEEED